MELRSLLGSLCVSLDSLLVTFSQFCIQTGAINDSARRFVDWSQAKCLYTSSESLCVALRGR
jgi:hypothetical protein